MAWDSGLKVCSTMHSSSMPQKPAHSCASRRKNTFQHRSRLPALAWSLLLSPIFLQQADGWQSGWAPRVTGLQRHSPHVRYDVSLSQFLGGQHEPRKRAPGVQFVTMVSAPESRTDLRKDGSSSDDSISEKPLVPGRPHTPESRAKISAANKGKAPWNQGKKHSETTRALIRERTRVAMQARRLAKVAEMGMTLEEYEEMKRIKAQEEKARKRAAKKNATSSEDFKAKMSARMRERWQDPEYREEALKKLNESRAMQTEETRRKISERMKRVWEETRHSGNRTVTDETRRKISETLKIRFADPELRQRLSSTRRRDPEHNQKISDAIRRKWADSEYKNKTLTGMQSYLEHAKLEPKEATPRKRAASTTASGKPRAKRTSASRQRLIAAELQELDRLDREMRGEIRSRKLRTTLTPQERPAARSRVKEMVKQAQNIWDQIYSEDEVVGVSSSLSGEEAKVLQVLTDDAPQDTTQPDHQTEPQHDVPFEEELDESEIDWRRHLEYKAKTNQEELELKARIKEARSRAFDEGPVSTEVFKLVNGKVAVMMPPPPPPEPLVSPDLAPAPPHVEAKATVAVAAPRRRRVSSWTDDEEEQASVVS